MPQIRLRPALAAACTVAAGLTAAPAAQAINSVTAANGSIWNVHDAARPGLDTGSIRTVGGGNGQNAVFGFANLRMKVTPISPTDPTARLDGEMLRGFGLDFDGVDRFTTTSAVTVGGIAVERDLQVRRSANWARWLDSFTNTTGIAKTVEVSFGGAAGQNTGTGQSRVLASGSGDQLISGADAWVATGAVAAGVADPTDGPSLVAPSAVVLGTPEPFTGALTGTGNHQRAPFTSPLPATGMEANFYGYRQTLTIPAGQTRTLLRYVVLGRAETMATAGTQIDTVTTAAAGLAATPDTTGIPTGDLCRVANWDPSTLPGYDAAACAALPMPEPPAQPALELPRTTSDYDVVGKTIAELKADLESGVTTSQEIVRAYLDRIAAYDSGQLGFHALISVNEDAMALAKAADQARADGDTRPLLGIPLLPKDNYDTKDLPTTTGTLALEGYVPDRDAFQIARLRDAGAIFIGKANMSEFANSGGLSESGWGQVWNGWNPSKTSFGSSGGTGSGVAVSFAPAGLGSQTGVSLYAPATGHGLATMRGTDGQASGAGISPLTFLQDFGGPIARTTTDLALILNATAGTDPEDPQTVDADERAPGFRPVDWTASLSPTALQGKRIGYLPSSFTPPTYGDTRTVDALLAKFALFEAAGATMVPMTTAQPGAPTTAQGFPNPGGAARRESGWQSYFSRSEDPPFTTGAGVLSSPKVLPYNRQTPTDAAPLTDEQVQQILDYRFEYKQRLAAWMDVDDVDAVVYPGFRSEFFDNDSGTLSSDRNSGIPVSNAGMPTVVVPVGTSPFGDPISLQLMGKGFTDAEVLGMGFALEQQVGTRLLSAAAPKLAFDATATPTPVVQPEPAPEPESPVEPVPADNATVVAVSVPVAVPVDRPVPGPPVAVGPARLRLTTTTADLRRRDGRIRLSLANTGDGAFLATTTLRTTLRGRRVTIGKVTVSLAPGATRRVAVRLSPTATRALRTRRTLRTTVVASTLAASGAVTSTNRVVTVRR